MKRNTVLIIVISLFTLAMILAIVSIISVMLGYNQYKPELLLLASLALCLLAKVLYD